MLSGGPLMLAVFIVLAIVIAIYIVSKRVKENKTAIYQLKKEKVNAITETLDPSEQTPEEEVVAFLAIHLYLTQNKHDIESNVLTIDRITRRYSPWSSKIYSMNNFQR